MKAFKKHRVGIKDDHDSDCAVYNEPAMLKGNCNCGLMPSCIDGIRDYLKQYGSFTHEGEKDSIISAFQAGYNFKTKIGVDIEYILDEFRELESDYFDKEGNNYPSYIPQQFIMEMMLHLINKLEEHIKQQDNTDWAL